VDSPVYSPANKREGGLGNFSGNAHARMRREAQRAKIIITAKTGGDGGLI